MNIFIQIHLFSIEKASKYNGGGHTILTNIQDPTGITLYHPAMESFVGYLLFINKPLYHISYIIYILSYLISFIISYHNIIKSLNKSI